MPGLETFDEGRIRHRPDSGAHWDQSLAVRKSERPRKLRGRSTAILAATLPGTLICPVDHVTIMDLLWDLLLGGLLSGTPSGIIPLGVFGRARKGGGHGNERNRSG
jgi:hypothetical protein